MVETNQLLNIGLNKPVEEVVPVEKSSYDFVSLDPGNIKPSAKESVYTYTGESAADSLPDDDTKPASAKYPEVPNYLMHTSTRDDVILGKDTRVIESIQSDIQADGVPVSNNKTWLAKGIEREIIQAASDKRTQVAIPISGDIATLNRSEETQEWYSTQVTGAVKKIAKQQGMDFAMKTVDGVEYATVSGKPNGVSMYASTAEATGAAYAMVQAGTDPKVELADQGYDEAEITSIMADVKTIAKAIEVGYELEEVLSYLKQTEPDIATVEVADDDPSVFERVKDFMLDPYKNDPAVQKYRAAIAESSLVSTDKLSASELLTNLQVIQPNMASVTTRISGAIGNSDDFTKARILEESSARRVLDLAKARGINLMWEADPDPDPLTQLSGAGQFYLDTEAGPVPLDTKAWADIEAEQNELYGTIGGGLLGAKYGAKLAVAAVSKVTKHPGAIATAAFVGGAAGSFGGAAGGAIAGTELDYLKSSAILVESMSVDIAARKALTAAESSVIGDLLGVGLIKSSSAIWQSTVAAKNFLVGGNTVAAEKALMSRMNLNESEVTDVINNLRKVTKDDLLTTTYKTVKDFDGNAVDVGVPTLVSKLSAEDEAIRAMALTQPGGEGLISSAGGINADTVSNTINAIDARAKDVLASAAELTNENIGRVLVDDLSNYTADVKKFYGDVKGQVISSPRINSFTFDYDKLAINPVIDQLEKNITDPTVLERYILQSQRIKGMSTSRTLADLIEVRQLVNDFKFNKRITQAKDFGALNKVINDIDGAIKVGARQVLSDPEQWLKDFGTAKKQYAQMKGLEKNVIAKVLRRPGITEDVVVKALTKYISDIDGSFQDVMSKLPKKSRELTEGAVIKALGDKFTAGSPNLKQATNFPMLATELDKVAFTQPGPRKLKGAIKELAEVFRNDVTLAQANSNLQVPKFQAYLTTDPIARVKYEIASGIFNRIKRLKPGKENTIASLIYRTAKLLDNPLNTKAVKDIMDDIADDVVLSDQIIALQQESVRAAAAGADATAPKVNMYGDGKILSFKGSGTPQKIPAHRIATYENRQTIADTYGIDIGDTKKLDKYMSNEGYIAVQLGTGKVRRIN